MWVLCLNVNSPSLLLPLLSYIQTQSQGGTLPTRGAGGFALCFCFLSWGGSRAGHFVEPVTHIAFRNKGRQVHSLSGADLCLHTAVFGYVDMVQKFGKLPHEIIVYLFFSGEQSFE